MGKSIPRLACLLVAAGWFAPAVADDYSGRFVGDFGGEEYRLALNPSGGNQYEGEITIGGVAVPLVARRLGDGLYGTVGIGGDSFEFSAELQGNVLLLHDDNGETIRLSRE